ncbi:protein-glutamate methylesterase/protein-glutamine glutaminase [Halalkalibacillus halophilus]|uniref:protein-glutamate methylesterase/protein-glutamine glutaminase n=1 Tax=Halalkalibacillus halophilus TaxID=392827 RepID=UPI0003F91443|nr:chemotaxis response regulator protein-glutamate methylesterase [Halalkalibacillus halophilus]
MKKVLIIDDSAFMRKVISDIINRHEQLEVVGTARNGEDGLLKVGKLKPDVVTLDIEMPVLNGLEALEQIMKQNPLPVVMLSSLTTEGAKSTIEALELGAVDFVQKPSGAISLDIETIEATINQKVLAATNANLKESERKPRTQGHQLRVTDEVKPNFNHLKTVVAIGVSTGGPKALQQVISNLPKNINAPIFIVQHMPAKFTASLAERLDRLSSVQVKEAVHGEIAKNGVVYIAPGDYHMTLKQVGRSIAVNIDQEDVINGHRPSVNKLFNSLSELKQTNKILSVLTGMGSDGKDGVKNLIQKDPSTYVIAESSESAVIYGMPKAIIENGLANDIQSINRIADHINKAVPNEGGNRYGN